MSLQGNKQDFQEVLESMQVRIDSMREIVSEEVLETFSLVITEYNDHFKSDIEGLMEECDDMRNRLSGYS